jgi:hypothetical protein
MAHSVAVCVNLEFEMAFVIYVNTLLIHDSDATADTGIQSTSKHGFAMAVNLLFRAALKEMICKKLPIAPKAIFTLPFRIVC